MRARHLHQNYQHVCWNCYDGSGSFQLLELHVCGSPNCPRYWLLLLPNVRTQLIKCFSFFGFLIVISFCDFKFVKENFLFLKTTTGRGIFDIFCAFLFLVTSHKITSYIMMGALGVCGVFFIVAGTVMKKDVAGADFNSKDVAARASV